jgi:tryptophan 2-monooxygenase
MSFIASPSPAKDTVNPADYPATYVDILYDHAGYLRANQGQIAQTRMDGQRIVIIGAGAAGLLAAYQLLQTGADAIILEASDRAGGRLYTEHPIPGDAAAFELGAMRVPPCEQIFNYYTKQFGINPGGQFPDPGKVNTRIIYRNKPYEWAAGAKEPPAIFNNVNTAWNALATQLSGISKLLTKPTPQSLASAQAAWQKLVYRREGLGPEEGYSTISFYQGLVQAFVENYQQYGLAQPWTGDDFELFAALGVGSGGFGPLYSVNFAEIARLIINGLESDQQFYPGGMKQLVDSFLASTPDPKRPSLKLGDCIRYGERAIEIIRLDPPEPLSVRTDKKGVYGAQAIIVATTTRSMQVDMNLTDQAQTMLPQPVSSAVRELHLMNSSKLFVLTKTKFWQNPIKKLPSNIQADTLVRGLYCLDYTPTTPYQGLGVVLISYTWGDDSTKYLALKNPRERLEACLRSIDHCANDFVAALRPEIITDHIRMIDWQEERNYLGAFKLNQPGQDQYNQRLYAHFLGGGGVYLAGDSVGWCGGWIESALQSGMNAACAVTQQLLGPNALFTNSPMTQKAALYDYGPNLSLHARPT